MDKAAIPICVYVFWQVAIAYWGSFFSNTISCSSLILNPFTLYYYKRGRLEK